VLIAAALNLTASSSRMEKLYRTDQELPWYDVPGVGVDGLISFLASIAAWAGPLLLVWAVARWRDGRLSGREAPRPETAEARRALGRTILISAGVFAAIVVAADMHSVHERYLTPILAATPLWLALALPLGRSARAVAGLAAALFLGALIGFWGMAAFGPHRYGYDYDAIAAEIRTFDPAPSVVLSPRHDDAANVTLALGWQGRAEPSFAPLADGAVLLWRGAGAAPEALVEEATEAGLAPASDARVFDMTFSNFSGEKKTFAFQLYARPAGASSGEPSGASAAPISGASPGSE